MLSSCTKTNGFLGDPEPFISNIANVTGKVINSQTGIGLAGAKVSFTKDKSAVNGNNAEYQAITDGSGNYTILNMPIGNYSEIVEASGFFSRINSSLDIVNGLNQLNPITLVQQPSINSLRFILTWGSSPADLDSHLTGPMASGGRFHIFFSNKAPTGAGANLDVDDTSSYGPETVTIQTFVDGTYRYSVFNYSNQTTTGGSAIYSSPAKVEVYDHSGLLQSFIAPAYTGSGNTWRVFEMTVTGGNYTFNPINTYVMASSSTDAATFIKGKTTIAKKNNIYLLNEW